MKIGDRVVCHISDSWEIEGTVTGIDIEYVPISPDRRAEYTISTGLFYTVRIDSSTVASGLRRDQLTLIGLEESPAQAYLELFQ